MKKSSICFAGLLVIIFGFSNLYAQDKSNKNSQTSKQIINIERSGRLQNLLQTAVDETFDKFKEQNLKPEELAATLIDLRDTNDLKMADVRGEEKIYPASVVKMFYMVALFEQIEKGKVKMTPEIERGLKEMIEVSSNDATHYIFDVITGTSGGAELSKKELAKYAFKKNFVNRYFTSLGYQSINVNQKTYCEDIFGRERQFWDGGKQRNKLTTNATAKLLTNIALGKTVSTEKSKQMMDLMKRDPFIESDDKDNQSVGYTGIALQNLNLKDAKLFSKAGWTSNSRHDAAYIETPDGLKFVLVVFTEKHANEREIIPTIAEKIIKGLSN
ncbi:MAG: serine hydrolase [Pyrinomonadaceae bacterium]